MGFIDTIIMYIMSFLAVIFVLILIIFLLIIYIAGKSNDTSIDSASSWLNMDLYSMLFLIIFAIFSILTVSIWFSNRNIYQNWSSNPKSIYSE